MNRFVQGVGIAVTVVYGAAIVWLYATQPRSIAELKNAAAVQANVYEVEKVQFDEALRAFRVGEYEIAVDHFVRADPAKNDPKTQFLIAYSYFAQGKGKVYDDEKFKLALEAVDRAIAIAPNNVFTLDDPGLKLEYTSADRLRQRLKQGLEVTPGDFNPF